ncbi:ATP synthase F1 subunit epsilon [Atribacter laminatus]|jgi:F-type H+-transporting ATPase subunit epsilon|uniref:ATP synthase epsilon chain n=1 Tax=Atribacter laminatus TaxID=2847778 RepID=A0A7T1F3G6_ATRLM|nr:ATP synthase F1 subunit epsilon [Atribacter laminatus]QPM68852.1 ATP synthase epsilon chain [Atribacter laminatus]
MKKMELHIVTPERTSIFPEVYSITLECPDGLRGILPGHAPFLVELLTGVLKYTTQDDQKKYVAISGGAAEITPYQVTIITDSAESADTIDIARAQEAATRAQQRIKDKTPGTDFIRAEAALKRSLARLRAAELAGKTGRYS